MAYPAVSWAVREAFLARVADGARPSHVAGRGGMPTLSAVNGWVRREPGFAALYAAAKAKGAWRRRGMLDEAAAAEILRRLAAGEAIGKVLRGPGMPSLALYRAWRRGYPAFGAEVARINLANRQAVRMVLARDRWRPFDRALADKVVVRVFQGVLVRDLARLGEGLPGARVLARWRREDADFDTSLAFALRVAQVAQRRQRRCTADLTDEIFERVARGATLAQVARDPRMPSRGTLYAWMRRQPEFAKAMAWALEARSEALGGQALAVAMRPDWERGRRAQVGAMHRSAERLRAKVALLWD